MRPQGTRAFPPEEADQVRLAANDGANPSVVTLARKFDTTASTIRAILMRRGAYRNDPVNQTILARPMPVKSIPVNDVEIGSFTPEPEERKKREPKDGGLAIELLKIMRQDQMTALREIRQELADARDEMRELKDRCVAAEEAASLAAERTAKAEELFEQAGTVVQWMAKRKE